MKVPFTMTQYIEHYQLNVNPHDTPALRVIAKHLRKSGYTRKKVRINGVSVWGWTKPLFPQSNLDQLREKLRELR